MSQFVDISFDCYPLRSIGRFDCPVDASPAFEALMLRIRQAAEKHGRLNTYYLCNAGCVFHLTNDEKAGMIEFSFEGTVLTDSDDRQTIGCDLQVELRRDVCNWLTAPVVDWFAETVSEAVKVEFDRYIAGGDLEKTVQRIEKTQAESDAHGGFMGLGI